MTGIIAGAEHEAEKLFPPRPGGLVDTARKARAAVDELAAQAPQQDAAGARFDPVRTQLRVPEVASATTIVVATGAANTAAVQRLAGTDGQRYKAVVMTLDEAVIVCFSRAAAEDPRNASNAAGMSAGGFVLPVNVPLPVDTTAEVWVAATSSTATRVSFIRQSYSA